MNDKKQKEFYQQLQMQKKKMVDSSKVPPSLVMAVLKREVSQRENGKERKLKVKIDDQGEKPPDFYYLS